MKAKSADDSLLRAVEHLADGDWEKAHVIVQEDSSKLAAWLHGIVHTLEGDIPNARYWYGQAGRAWPGPSHVKEEIQAARAAAQKKRD
jgi:hypothetical protein